MCVLPGDQAVSVCFLHTVNNGDIYQEQYTVMKVSFYEIIKNQNTFCHSFGSKRTVAILLKLLYTVSKNKPKIYFTQRIGLQNLIDFLLLCNISTVIQVLVILLLCISTKNEV